jgi:hypothetical protein
VDGTDSGTCLVAGFGITSIDPYGCVASGLVNLLFTWKHLNRRHH